MGTETKQIAIIGGGWVVQTIWLPLLLEAGFSVNVIIEPSSSVSDHLRGKYPNITYYNELTKESLINSSLLFICSPNKFHYEQALFGMLCGLDVCIDKPACFTLEEAINIIETSKSTNCRFWVSAASSERNDIKKIHEIIRDEGGSNINCLELSWIRANGIPKLGSWFTDKKEAIGGCGADLGWHMLEVGLGFLNYPKIVSAQTKLIHLSLLNDEISASWRIHHKKQKTKIEVPSVETGLYSNLITEFQQVIRLSTAWVSHQAYDKTDIKLFSTQGELHLECTFGLSPNGLKNSYLTYTRLGKVIRYNIDDSIKIEPYKKFIYQLQKNLSTKSYSHEYEHKKIISLSSAMQMMYKN